MSATQPCGIPCNMQHLTPDMLLRMLIRKDAETGCLALAVKQVDESSGDCSLDIDCDNEALSWKALVMSMIYFDADACPAVRVIID